MAFINMFSVTKAHGSCPFLKKNVQRYEKPVSCYFPCSLNAEAEISAKCLNDSVHSGEATGDSVGGRRDNSFLKKLWLRSPHQTQQIVLRREHAVLMVTRQK